MQRSPTNYYTDKKEIILSREFLIQDDFTKILFFFNLRTKKTKKVVIDFHDFKVDNKPFEIPNIKFVKRTHLLYEPYFPYH